MKEAQGRPPLSQGSSSAARRFRVALRVAVGIGLVAWLLRTTGLEALRAQLTGRALAGYLVATALLLAAQGLAAARWRLLLPEPRLRWSYLYRLYLIGSCFNLFLPTSVGGDSVRALALSRATGRLGPSLASVFLDRLLGVLALVAFAAAGVLAATGPGMAWLRLLRGSLAFRWPALAAALAVTACLGIALLLGRRHSILRVWARRVADAFRAVVTSRGRLALAAGFAVVVQGLMTLLWIALAAGLDLPVSPIVLLISVPLVSLAAMLPVSLAGLGVREWVWIGLLTPLGVPRAHVLVFSLLYFGCVMATGAIGALLLAVRGLAPRGSTAPGEAAA
jgi:uncharacterized membrane protein YbhN (UPF0104 family)